MAILPGSRDEMLDWFNDRIELWNLNALAVGLTTEQVTKFASRLSSAIAQRTDMIQKRNAAKASTTKLNDLADATHTEGSALIQTIKAYAATTGNPDVFDLSQVPQPKPAAPLPPPEAPTNVAAALTPESAIRVTWDGSIANGVTFIVYRRTDIGTGFGPQEIVGFIGARSIIDTGLTGCVHTAAYQIRAVRGAQFSPFSTEATIRFTPAGEGAGGAAAQAA